MVEYAGSLIFKGNYQPNSYNNHFDHKPCKLVNLQQATSMEAEKFLLNHVDDSVSSYVKQSFCANYC